MRQSFKDFLKKKGFKLRSDSYIEVDRFSELAEEWSSQQPEDEVVEALSELYKCCLIAFDEDVSYPNGSRSSTKSTEFITAIDTAKAILAKRKESR